MWQRYSQDNHIFEKSLDNGASWVPMPINASSLEGTVPPSVLGGAIAYTNVDNNFTAAQHIHGADGFYIHGAGYSRMHLRDTSQPATTQTWHIINYQQFLWLAPSTDDLTGWSLGVAMKLSRSCDLFLYAYLYPGFYGGGIQSSYFLSAHSTWGLYSNTSVKFAGGIYTDSLINIAGTLTVGGAGQINGAVNTGALTVTGAIRATTTIGCDTNQWRSNFHPHGAIYLGVAGVPRASYLLDGNDTYGVYCNTGLYLENYLWCVAVESRAHIRAAAGLYDYGRANPIGVWIGFGAGAWANGGGIAGGTATLNYMLVGKSMYVIYQITSIYVHGGVTEIYITIPYACSTGMANVAGTVTYFNGQAWDGTAGGALAYCMNGEAFIRHYRTQSFTASNDVGGAVQHLWGQICIPVA